MEWLDDRDWEQVPVRNWKLLSQSLNARLAARGALS
jgi:hypothetical protein